MRTDDALVTLASRWVSERDKMQARHYVLHNVRQREFMDVANDFARQLGSVLPLMTPAEAQGFMELVNVWVSMRRQAEDTFRKR